MQKALVYTAVAVVVVVAAWFSRYDREATPEQIEKFQTVLEMYPELKDDYAKAESDGKISKQELLDMGKRAVEIKQAREKQ